MVIAIMINFFVSSPLPAENISLTTYYQAPFGVYDRLRLVPRASLATDPHCNDSDDKGVMYYDSGASQTEGLYVCEMNVKTGLLGWRLISQPEEITIPEGTNKVICVKSDGQLGVCTNNPSADGTCGCE